MNDNLKNFSVEPDPKVWDAVKKAERKAWAGRQLLTGVVGGLLVAGAIVTTVVWPSAQHESAMDMPQAGLPSMQMPDQQSAPNEALMAEVKDAPKAEQEALAAAAQVKSGAEEVALEVVAKAAKAEPVAMAEARSAERVQVVSRIPSSMAESDHHIESVAKVADRGVEDALMATVEQERQRAQSTPKVGGSTNVPDTIIWLPNAFAPASDDPDVRTFRARLNRQDASISNFKMVIYNRAGHQVFSSMDINTEWDGTYRGNRLPQGAYVYVLYYTDADGFQHQRKGTVTLIR